MSRYSNSRYAQSYLSHETYATMDDPTKRKSTKRMEGFSRFIWNPEESKFMGRTASSWCLLLLFYAIFYTVLVLFSAGMMTLFLHFVISNDEPFRTGQQSALKMIPGLGFRPLPDYRTNLIAYTPSDPQTYQLYTQNIQAFLNTYEKFSQISDRSFATCEPRLGKKSPEDPEKPCKFLLHYLEDCQKENMYGYERIKPCVILKMNKIYGWIPDTKHDHVLVNCKGKYDIETEMIGKLHYYPNITINGTTYGYFSNVYFPYLSQYGYRSPLVAVQFQEPVKNVVLLVQCQFVDLKGPSIPVTFELLYD